MCTSPPERGGEGGVRGNGEVLSRGIPPVAGGPSVLYEQSTQPTNGFERTAFYLNVFKYDTLLKKYM